jgi:hypothetical protein
MNWFEKKEGHEKNISSPFKKLCQENARIYCMLSCDVH